MAVGEPFYYAACRECVRELDPNCWVCAGQMFYPVAAAEKADLVLRASTHGPALTFRADRTPRFEEWLATLTE